MAGGKTYQVTQVDPLNPHTKGMVYQVNIVGGGTQMEELPEASADNVGQVYQYLGETDANFTHGYFYENKAQGTNPETYAWEAIDTQAGGAVSTANADLSNLTAAGANIANWSSNVSNCITEIPQDINLTLSNGTLTLKAGSKITWPDGTTITISADRTGAYTNDGHRMVFVSTSGYLTGFDDASACYSGATDPVSSQWHTWFDTTNNVINKYNNNNEITQANMSFPIAIVTVSDGAISSIDKVFNGFGYIGKTIFGLPGVKALIPDGRNADGSLKNIEYTKTSVGIVTNINPSMSKVLMLSDNGNLFDGKVWFDSKAKPNFLENYNNYWYNPDTNKVYYYRNSSTQYYINCVLVGRFVTGSSAKIDALNTKCVFQSVDNDMEYIAHQAMPSSRYINLTLPATGGTVTAPADGYVFAVKACGSAGEYLTLTNNSNSAAVNSYPSTTGFTAKCLIPVSKGDIVAVTYSVSGTTQYFRFVYANGAQ